MTLPGFTAESSLYTISTDYRLLRALLQAGGIMPQLVDPVGTDCLPCDSSGEQLCVNCFIEPGRCFSWYQRCSPVLR
jgi:hypothetical protein